MHRKEKKMRENHGKKGIIYAENLVKALLCAYLVTGMFLLILALLLYKAGLSEENVNLGIILIYVIGTFCDGKTGRPKEVPLGAWNRCGLFCFITDHLIWNVP